MSDAENWLDRFEQSLADLKSPTLFWVALSMLIPGVVGLLWSLPSPEQFFDISPLLNWGSAFLMVTAIYYFIISLSLAIGLLPFLLGLAALQMWLMQSPYPQQGVSIALLISGATGLVLGRRANLRHVVQDIQLMMMAPAWLLALVYRRFAIPI